MDHHIGLLLNHLEEVGLYEPTWIIVTADHGELLNEHGTKGHGEHLYQQEIAVPLFIKYPAGAIEPHRSDRAIQQTDILPMLLDHLGIPRPEGVTGGIPRQIDHPTFAEVYPLEGVGEGAWLAIFAGRYKLLWNSLGQHQLFDLEADPDELHNLARAEPERVKEMELAISEFLDRQPRPAEQKDRELVDEETRRALQSLGYLE
jgi:arylsulfatase A-like enzyme